MSTRLVFLEAKISEQLEFECEAKFKGVEADLQRELVGVATSKDAKDLLEKVCTLEKQVDLSLADMGGPFRVRLALLESEVIEAIETLEIAEVAESIRLGEALNAAVLAEYDQVVKVESAREALIMQVGFEKLAMQEQCQALSVMNR
ncbi:hypothetical protein [Piscirickettsia salmonis]|uniref:hypothetical protein n=1 Tax=Piscirickettsia salmonis TaxID=1238 RepID=UPI0007D7B74A|nr:hypothetical protein A0O36_00053 [Piscirickettsiaceae bacterium NZ-RLO1]